MKWHKCWSSASVPQYILTKPEDVRLIKRWRILVSMLTCGPSFFTNNLDSIRLWYNRDKQHLDIVKAKKRQEKKYYTFLTCKHTTACCGQFITSVRTVSLPVTKPVLGNTGMGAQAAERICCAGHWT